MGLLSARRKEEGRAVGRGCGGREARPGPCRAAQAAFHLIWIVLSRGVCVVVALWKMDCRGQKRKQEQQLGDHQKSPCKRKMMAFTREVARDG